MSMICRTTLWDTLENLNKSRKKCVGSNFIHLQGVIGVYLGRVTILDHDFIPLSGSSILDLRYFPMALLRPSFLLRSQICSACRLPIEDGDSVLQPASGSRKTFQCFLYQRTVIGCGCDLSPHFVGMLWQR